MKATRSENCLTDKDFLLWIYNRLRNVHNESPNFKHMQHLKTLAHKDVLTNEELRELVPLVDIKSLHSPRKRYFHQLTLKLKRMFVEKPK